ncbi:hypothetical protein IAD21_00363 [Abditibacteriota bacterium]|nr:hypothetical protein IAD21_00363 [Abditibacteriota bacterium]
MLTIKAGTVTLTLLLLTPACVVASEEPTPIPTASPNIIASQSADTQSAITSQGVDYLSSPGKKSNRSVLLGSSAGFEIEYALRSTLRGRQFSRKGVRAPDMVVSAWRASQGTTLSLTSDVEMGRDTREGHLLETTLSASRTLRYGNIRIEPGFYLYLRDRYFGSSTGEVALSVGRRSGALRWFVDGFVDVLRARGDCLMQMGVSHRFSPSEKSLVKTSLLFGRSSERVNDELGFFTDTANYATLSASWTRDVSSRLSVRPRLEATRFLSGDARTFLKLSVALQWNS